MTLFTTIELDHCAIVYLADVYMVFYRCGHLCYVRHIGNTHQCCRCQFLVNRCKVCA